MPKGRTHFKRHFKTHRRARKRTSHRKMKTSDTLVYRPHNNQYFFPQRYVTTSRTTAQLTVSLVASPTPTGVLIYYKGNSPISSGPSINNYNTPSQALFATSFPSGLHYVLGSSSGNNGAPYAPYFQFRCTSSSIKVTFTPVVTGQNTGPYDIVLLPVASVNTPTVLGNHQSVHTQIYGMSLATIREQPFAKVIRMNPVNTSSYAATIKHRMSTKKIFGDKYKATLDDEKFYGYYNQDPNYVWDWAIALYSATLGISSDTVLTGVMEVDLYHNLEFKQRNLFESIAPQ